jgi:hypothetical protein
MNPLKLLIFSSLTACILFSCNNDTSTVTNYKWKVINYTFENVNVVAENDYFLEFEGDKSYRFRLDVNNCGGGISRFTSNRIEFEMANCTEACCDSEFASKVISFLPFIKTYSIDGNILLLEGDNNRKIRLSRTI